MLLPLTEISLNKEHNGLYEFRVKLGEVGGGYEPDGFFYSDVEDPLVIGQEYEYRFDGNLLILKGFLPKHELLKKIDENKPIDIKVIEELKAQTIFLNKMSYRIGWFYYLSIISLITSIILYFCIFFNIS